MLLVIELYEWRGVVLLTIAAGGAAFALLGEAGDGDVLPGVRLVSIWVRRWSTSGVLGDIPVGPGRAGG